ncbi:hypothetical protein H2203_004703 [Taxawa tesnikishii (nom. ined.)]|nr:hypothetical protein H2203_004703 [Dothideales sp. JES 119]
MAVWLPRGLCAFCKHQAPLPFRTSITQPPLKKLHTSSHSPPADKDALAIEHDLPSLRELQKLEGDGPVLSPQLSRHQLELESSVDLVREALLNDFSRRYNNNEMRLSVQRALAETPIQLSEKAVPVPMETPLAKVSRTTSAPRPESAASASHPPHPFPLNGQPLPLDAFRENMATAFGQKGIRRILREQLLRCQWPEEILRVAAVAMKKKETAKEFAHMHQSIRRALYRIRNNVSDPKVLSTLNVIIVRLSVENLPVDGSLFILGLKFAARSRSLQSMKRYLKYMRDRNLTISRSIFRAIIAKFSVGSRGLGEIRNGRWTRQDLLQVLLGFDGTPPGKPTISESGWIGQSGKWELWRVSETRRRDRRLQSMNPFLTAKIRGDNWFIEQMCHAGDTARAWIMLKESGIPFNKLRPYVREMLLDGADGATVWDKHIAAESQEKLSQDIEKIEQALGVMWISQGDNGEGYHVTKGVLEETLENLASPEFALKPMHGFPWDASEAGESKSLWNVVRMVY